MNCDCLSTTATKLKEGFGSGKIKLNKPGNVNRVTCTHRTLLAADFSDAIGIPFSIYVEGKAKPIEMPVIASYCPFCGKGTAKPVEAKEAAGLLSLGLMSDAELKEKEGT